MAAIFALAPALALGAETDGRAAGRHQIRTHATRAYRGGATRGTQSRAAVANQRGGKATGAHRHPAMMLCLNHRPRLAHLPASLPKREPRIMRANPRESLVGSVCRGSAQYPTRLESPSRRWRGVVSADPTDPRNAEYAQLKAIATWPVQKMQSSRALVCCAACGRSAVVTPPNALDGCCRHTTKHSPKAGQDPDCWCPCFPSHRP